jgi:hypothetical protein
MEQLKAAVEIIASFCTVVGALVLCCGIVLAGVVAKDIHEIQRNKRGR